MFNASSAKTYTFDVPLVNDDAYEIIENFNAQLSFVETAERVTIDPGSAQVQIEDDDGNFYSDSFPQCWVCSRSLHNNFFMKVQKLMLSVCGGIDTPMQLTHTHINIIHLT